MLTFRSFLETAFMTAKGSTYQFDRGRSKRNKVKHDFHEPGDVGEKEISDKTIFVNSDVASEIGWWGQSNAAQKRLILADNKVWLISWNQNEKRMGMDRIEGDNSYALFPEVGKNPLELWHLDKEPYPWRQPGMEVYKKSHPGTPIVKMS